MATSKARIDDSADCGPTAHEDARDHSKGSMQGSNHRFNVRDAPAGRSCGRMLAVVMPAALITIPHWFVKSSAAALRRRVNSFNLDVPIRLAGARAKLQPIANLAFNFFDHFRARERLHFDMARLATLVHG